MTMDHASAEDLLERLAAARMAFDGDGWTDAFTEDAVLQRDPADPPLVGHNALRADLLEASRSEEQVAFTWERHWVVSPTILAPWRMSYVHRESRARVSLTGFATLELAADDRIARSRWWFFRHELPAGG
jgi:hypothetical protein